MTDQIPADDALNALDDSQLLDLMVTHGIDAGTVADRAGALAALQAKRDAEPAQPPAEDQPEAPPPAAEDPTAADVAENDAVINTIADEDEVVAAKPQPPKLSAVLAQAVKDAMGDPVKHAALHNFEAALTDFRNAATNLLAVKGVVDFDTPLGRFVQAVTES